MQIPSGLGALLAKLGLGGPMKEGQLGQTQTPKGDAKGLTAAVKEGLEKGLELGPDGELLSGLGYNEADKESGKKNINEKSNVERFLQETGVERPEAENPFANLGDAVETKGEAKEAADKTTEAGEQNTEAGEKREAADGDIRRDEKADEGRIQGQQEAETKETNETKEAEEADAQQQQPDEDDEEDKPGAGWVAEELEEEEEARKRGLKDADALGDAHRCKGHLDDGSFCLRKPVSGTPYCAEHAATWQAPLPIEKA